MTVLIVFGVVYYYRVTDNILSLMVSVNDLFSLVGVNDHDYLAG